MSEGSSSGVNRPNEPERESLEREGAKFPERVNGYEQFPILLVWVYYIYNKSRAIESEMKKHYNASVTTCEFDKIRARFEGIARNFTSPEALQKQLYVFNKVRTTVGSYTCKFNKHLNEFFSHAKSVKEYKETIDNAPSEEEYLRLRKLVDISDIEFNLRGLSYSEEYYDATRIIESISRANIGFSREKRRMNEKFKVIKKEFEECAAELEEFLWAVGCLPCSEEGSSSKSKKVNF